MILDIPINPIEFDNTASPEQIVDLPEREILFYKVTVPAGRTSWQIHLAESLTNDAPPKIRDGGMAIRRDRIPAFDSGKDPNARGGANVKLIPMGDHWALLPTTTAGCWMPGTTTSPPPPSGRVPPPSKPEREPVRSPCFQR